MSHRGLGELPYVFKDKLNLLASFDLEGSLIIHHRISTLNFDRDIDLVLSFGSFEVHASGYTAYREEGEYENW